MCFFLKHFGIVIKKHLPIITVIKMMRNVDPLIPNLQLEELEGMRTSESHNSNTLDALAFGRVIYADPLSPNDE